MPKSFPGLLVLPSLPQKPFSPFLHDGQLVKTIFSDLQSERAFSPSSEEHYIIFYLRLGSKARYHLGRTDLVLVLQGRLEFNDISTLVPALFSMIIGVPLKHFQTNREN